jgi:hypothetical protein
MFRRFHREDKQINDLPKSRNEGWSQGGHIRISISNLKSFLLLSYNAFVQVNKPNLINPLLKPDSIKNIA